MNDHIGDDAELYALGVLSNEERERIDAHLAACGECSKAVGDAERVTLALDAIAWPTPRVAKAPSLAWLATAASLALAVGLGTSLAGEHAQLAAMHREDDVALATIATSHFLHASFVPKDPTVYPAKVLYARDAAWTYVIVDGPAEKWRVTGTSASGVTDIAMLHAHGFTSVAFATPHARFESLQLLDASGRTVATATMTYPRAAP